MPSCFADVKIRVWLFLGFVYWSVVAGPLHATEVTQLRSWLDSNVHHWRWHFGEAPGAGRPDFDDSQWQPVDLGFKWWPHDSTGWFRVRITFPETINGIPIDGGPVRLKVAVDNAAQAYVNGVFKQDFEWAKGDFILSEHARPGEVITVALHAVNRPGSGSLLEASLVNGHSEPLVDALRGAVKDFDSALEDAPYVSEAEAAQTRTRVHDAIQALDIKAYQTCNQDTFLASIEKARAILLSDRATVESRLKQTSENLQALKKKIQNGRQAGRSMAYGMLDARVVESFLRYARDDLAENHSGHQLRGMKAVAYIEKLCTDALNHDTPEPAITPYKTGPFTIRDGAFWKGDRPIYFTGAGHFGQQDFRYRSGRHPCR